LRGYIRGHLVQESYDFEEPLYRVVEEKRALLDYYKNTSVHFFVSMGVLSSILAKNESDRISRASVEADFLFLQGLLDHEFTFSRRQDVSVHVDRLFDFLKEKGWARVEGDEIALSTDARPHLALFASPVKNFLESYEILWKTLPHLGTRRWESKDLLRFLSERGRILYLKETIDRPEAINKFTLQNAIAAFRDAGLLKEEVEGWGRRKRTFYQQVSGDPNKSNYFNRLFN
jgi:glycerol-3-phosphate O-acyltransferase